MQLFLVWEAVLTLLNVCKVAKQAGKVQLIPSEPYQLSTNSLTHAHIMLHALRNGAITD